jgi:hypothetical protein
LRFACRAASDERVEMSVEICAYTAKFSGFSKNQRVYDDFPISQLEIKPAKRLRVQVQTGRGLGATAVSLMAACAFKHQGEK